MGRLACFARRLYADCRLAHPAPAARWLLSFRAAAALAALGYELVSAHCPERLLVDRRRRLLSPLSAPDSWRRASLRGDARPAARASPEQSCRADRLCWPRPTRRR